MNIHSADFVKSSALASQCPSPDKHEYAFIGRSNVGKSSLINMLVQRKKLAKTSSTPGKTQLINHFIINEEWYIADLPGYGYAKVSKKARADWKKMIRKYILTRENLMCLFLLIDARHEAQKLDLDFMEWMGKSGIPFALIFTKIDKLSGNQLDQNISEYKKVLDKTWEFLPDIFLSSAETKEGREKIMSFIEHINKTVNI